MAVHGVSFRATSGFVTDGADDTYDLGAQYPVTRAGITFGWASDRTSNSRDRVGLTSKMAGINFVSNAGTVDWTLDLPDGPGTYDVRIALGDESNSQNCKAIIKDTSTTKLTIDDATFGDGSTSSTFLDASEVLRTEATWIANNVAASIVFATSTMVVTLGGYAGGSGNSTIAYISVNQTASGGGPVTVGASGSAATVGVGTQAPVTSIGL